MRRSFRFLAGITVIAGAVLAVQTEPAARNGVTIVMRRLENPRGMAIGPEGALYVVEAGKGGPELSLIHI